MYDVITIGSITRDSFYKTELQTIKWKTPEGKAYVLPLGEKIGVRDMYATIGGNSANAAVTFARQGLRTVVVGRVGKDLYGEDVKRRLAKEGINTSLIHLSDKPTASAVLILQDGERTILSYHGATEDFSKADLNFKNIKSKWFYVSLPGDSYKLFKNIVAYANKHNILIAINPSGKHLKDGKRELIPYLKNIGLLVLNEGEASTLTGIPFEREKEVFKKIDALVPGIVAVTSGPNGVTISDGRFIYKAGVFQEKQIADRTGAGDAFGSGLVSGLIVKDELCVKGICDPEKIKYAIRFASANATSVVEYVGATEGILTKNGFKKSPRWRNFKITTRRI